MMCDSSEERLSHLKSLYPDVKGEIEFAHMLNGAGLDVGVALADDVVGRDSFPGSLIDLPYLAAADRADPMVFPGLSSEILADFPPTLLLTGSRDFAAGSLSLMHRRLTAAGADSRLFLFDGLWHAFHIFPDLPESLEVYGILADFFARELSA